jgi:hypothetical protein
VAIYLRPVTDVRVVINAGVNINHHTATETVVRRDRGKRTEDDAIGQLNIVTNHGRPMDQSGEAGPATEQQLGDLSLDGGNSKRTEKNLI